MPHPPPPSRSIVLLRQIERAAGVGGWELDLATHSLTWTDQVYRIHDVEPETFQPTLEAASAFLVPGARPILGAAIQAAIDAGAPWELELELVTAKGNHRWVRSVGEPEMRGGSCVRLTGAIQDVTEQHEAREALRARTMESRKFATVAQNTRNLVMVTDAADRIEWVNQSFCRVTGYSLPEAQGKRPRDLLSRSDIEGGDRYREASDRWHRGQPVVGALLRLYRKDGTPYWAEVEIRPVRNETGAVTHHIHIHNDVTAQHEAEEKSQHLANSLKRAAQAAGIGTLIQDLRTGEVVWDTEVFRIHGFPVAAQAPSREQVLARIHRDDRTRFERGLQPLLEGDSVRDAEYRVVHADGRLVHVYVRGQVERDEKGEPVRLIGALMDVTERRVAELRAIATSEWLEMASSAMGVGLYYRDADEERGVWDRRMRAIFGIADSAPTLSPEEVGRMVVDEDKATYAAMRQHGETSPRPVEASYRIRRGDGQVRWIRSRRVALPVGEGRPARIFGTVIDVTEQSLDRLERQKYFERMQLAVDAGAIATWERNLITGEGRWDARMFSFFGLAPANVAPPSEQVVAMIHPEDRAMYLATWGRIVRENQAVEFDARAVQPDGTVRHIATHARADRRADGTPWRVVGATTDVTQLRRAQAQSREALERLQRATDVSGIGTWERDLRTGEARWDATLFALYGLQAADGAPTRERAVAMVHPDDRAGVEAAWTRIQQVHHAVEFDYRVVKPDDQIIYLNTRGMAERDAEGKPWRIVGATIDVTSQRIAQRQLREYDEWLRLAGAATEIGFFQVAVDGSYRRFDRQMRAMFGFAPDGPAPSSEQFDAAVVPEDRQMVRAARKRSFQADELVEVEYRVRLPNGSTRHIHTRRVRRSDAGGRPLYVIGTAVDVTRSRRTQQALQAAIARLRLATQTARIGIWQRELATGTVTWDARMCEIYGVQGVDWQPTRADWLRRIHPDDRGQAARAHDEGLEGGTSEYRIVLPDGSIRHVAENHVARRGPQGERVSLLGTNLDITEIRSAQQERDLLSERVKLAAESIGLGVWDWDLLANTSVWNDRMYALFGRTREEFADHLWSDFVHPDDVARARAAITVAIAAGSQCDVEFRVVLPDATLRWLASRSRVQRDVVGTPIRMIGVNWDVTDKRTTEAALRDKETAERANQAKSEFLSRMSHELRTPLNAILGFAQVLELDRKSPLAETQVERVRRIQKAGWHLLTLINEVLELSRIEAGALSISLGAVTIASVVQESIELVSATAAQRGITVVARIDPQAPATAHADSTRLKQVLLNLLSNAIKYNRDRGRVDVSVERDGNTIRVGVRDTGRGMSEAQLAKIFQPFNRLGLEDGAIEGTGIGLSITRRLVELMGGRIDVTTEVGVGSEFTVWLAIDDGLPKEAAPALLPGAVSDAQPLAATVLYVEDNPLNRAVVRELLALRPGIRLLEAESGTTGLALAVAEHPDLVLIDLHLPDMDGIEWLRRLRAQGEDELPCILLSASGRPGESERARQAGFLDYWTKPIAAATFLQALDGTLGQRHSQARA